MVGLFKAEIAHKPKMFGFYKAKPPITRIKWSVSIRQKPHINQKWSVSIRHKPHVNPKWTVFIRQKPPKLTRNGQFKTQTAHEPEMVDFYKAETAH